MDANGDRLFNDPVVLQRVDPAVNFDWAAGAPAPVLGEDGFMARWSGYVTAPTTGSYSFGAVHSGGVRITVGGTQVLNRVNYTAGPTNYGTTVNLTAGQAVPITVEYFESTLNAVMKLWVRGWIGAAAASTNEHRVVSRSRRGTSLKWFGTSSQPRSWNAGRVTGERKYDTCSRCWGTVPWR